MAVIGHPDEGQDAQRENRSFFVHMLVGTVVGVVIGAVTFTTLLAVVIAQSDQPHSGAAWIGVLVGSLFGSFLGGWGGVVRFDAKHHEHRP